MPNSQLNPHDEALIDAFMAAWPEDTPIIRVGVDISGYRVGIEAVHGAILDQMPFKTLRTKMTEAEAYALRDEIKAYVDQRMARHP